MANPAANPPALAPAPKLVSSSVEGGFDIRFSWTVDFNILKPPAKRIAFAPCTSPLVGEWYAAVGPASKVEGAFSVWVYHDGLKYEQLGTVATVELSLNWVQGVPSGQIRHTRWIGKPVPNKQTNGKPFSSYSVNVTADRALEVAEQSDGLYVPAIHRQYRVDFSIRRSDTAPRSLDEELVKRMPCLSLKPYPDVRLFFPRFGEDGAELWTTRELLASSSAYLRTLLESEFLESHVVGSKRQRRMSSRTAAPPVDADAQDFEDSDDETHAFLLKTEPPEVTGVGDSFAYNQITVTKTAYSTYRAVLVFLQTRFIRFAPLSSACKPCNPSARSSGEEQLTGLLDESPAIPVSPKSAYRLAHLLELEDLQRYCLDALRKGLSVDGAAHELFSDVSACYDAWRAGVLEYVVEHWDEVSKTPSWVDTMAGIKAGEQPDAAGVVVELMEACEKRLSG